MSWLDLFTTKALFLVPVARFAGFVWLIAAGFALPRIEAPAAYAREHGVPRVA